MKKLEKMSLANVKSKLSRKEMKNIMAGSSPFGSDCKDWWGRPCGSTTPCSFNWQCTQYGYTCYQGYCNHVG